MDGWKKWNLSCFVFCLPGHSSRGLWAGEWWRAEDIWGDPARDHHFKVSCTITFMLKVNSLTKLIYLYTWFFFPSFNGVVCLFGLLIYFYFKGSLATSRKRSRTGQMALSDSLSRCFFPDFNHSDHLWSFIQYCQFIATSTLSASTVSKAATLLILWMLGTLLIRRNLQRMTDQVSERHD